MAQVLNVIQKSMMVKAVVVVKWSTFSPFIPTILVRIPLESTVLSSKLFEKNENKQKEAGDSPLKNSDGQK